MTVERVAKAIYLEIPNGAEVRQMTTASDQFGHPIYERIFKPDSWEDAPDRHQQCQGIALAALEAIAEPTPEMIEAGAEAMSDLDANQPSSWEDFVLVAWRAMHAAMVKDHQK